VKKSLTIALISQLASICLLGCVDGPSARKYEVSVEYSLDEDGYATIYMPEGRDLRILLLSDVQLSIGVSAKRNARTLDLVDELLEVEEPDLVVLTGDLTNTWTANNWGYVVRIGDLIERHQILWMPMFGNHDCRYSWEYSEGYFQRSKRQVVEGFKERYPLCLMSEGDCKDGVGNYFVNIKDEEGNIIYTLCAFDTVRYSDQKYSSQRTDAQVEWYTEHLRAISALQFGEGSKELVPSMVFAHLPVMQCYAWYQEAKDTDALFYGVAMEQNDGDPSWEDPFFETAKALGSTTAMFFGHDHKNDASFEVDGVRLTYGQHSSHSDYYRSDEEQSQFGDTRGATLVTITHRGESAGFGVSRVLETDL
jgi:hypothetical protein